MATKFDLTVYNGKLFNLSKPSKKWLTAIRAALDRHLRSPSLNKQFSTIVEPHLTDYSACMVYTKTIIDLSVDGRGIETRD